jgi:hypothetical protein
MKWTYSSLFLILFGLFGLFIIFLFQDITVSNEDDYYLLKEITEASMEDSLDIAYYRKTGEIKIIQEKFVEVFTRRFAESSTLSAKGYEIEFYDIIEEPPKVTVRIKNKTHGYTLNTDDFDVINELSAIIETNG